MESESAAGIGLVGAGAPWWDARTPTLVPLEQSLAGESTGGERGVFAGNRELGSMEAGGAGAGERHKRAYSFERQGDLTIHFDCKSVSLQNPYSDN